MRLLLTPDVTVALAILAVGRHIDIPVVAKTFGVDSSKAPPEFSPPEFAPATGWGDFDTSIIANEALWDKYLQKGNHLMCLMEATDRGAGFLSQDTRQPPSAASRWTGDMIAERKTWYWHSEDVEQGWDGDFEAQGLKTAFEGLGIGAKSKFDYDRNPQVGSNMCYNVQHYDDTMIQSPEHPFGKMVPIPDQTYTVGGKSYRATPGFYIFAINTDGGIIAQNIDSPRNAVLNNMGWRRPANPGELPELQFASDIFWGHWVQDSPNIKNLRVYGAHHVVNKDTSRLVNRALKNKGLTQLATWPGTVFPIGTEEFTALIASPIGATACHMLLQHKAELGIKRVSKVTVVTNEPSPKKNRKLNKEMHIFFSFEDVPADSVTKPGVEKRTVVRREMGRVELKLLSVRDEGRNMVREHIIMA